VFVGLADLPLEDLASAKRMGAASHMRGALFALVGIAMLLLNISDALTWIRLVSAPIGSDPTAKTNLRTALSISRSLRPP
jgi:hypothetical protein